MVVYNHHTHAAHILLRAGAQGGLGLATRLHTIPLIFKNWSMSNPPGQKHHITELE